MFKVNLHTRAQWEGSPIYCPHCNRSAIVYHFAWTALMCNHCLSTVNKFDWNTVEEDKEN